MRLLLALSFVSLAAPALAQGAISLGTPITFAAPATITHYDIEQLTIRPGAAASIHIVLVGRNRPDVQLTFEYPRDCVALPPTPENPTPTSPCPSRDTSAEIDARITALNTVNLSTRSLYRRIMDDLCADFPARFSGGCTVQ